MHFYIGMSCIQYFDIQIVVSFFFIIILFNKHLTIITKPKSTK